MWIMRSSGFGTFQTSLTPSSHTCGSRSSPRPNSRIAGARQVAPAALGQHGGLRRDVRARLEVAERLAVLAPALVARADAEHLAVLDDQLRGRGLGEDVGAAVLGLALLVAGQRGDRDHLVAVVVNGGGEGCGTCVLPFGSM